MGRSGDSSGSGRIVRHLSIYESMEEYCAWPSVARTADGDLIVVFCRSEEHMGPDGAILLSRSRDNGTRWLPPVTVYDTPIDDRESGFTVLRDGRILLHLWSTLHTPESYRALPDLAYERPVLDRWIKQVGTPEYRREVSRSGGWTMHSENGGSTWSAPVPGPDAVHGGIQLRDGTLLTASYRRERDSVGVYRAGAPMFSWLRIATIPSPQPDSLRFGEPHILQLPTGRVIMMMRVTTKPYNDGDPRCVLWGTYSDDGGVTWARPYPTPLWGFPPHLLQLADGRILCTYGYRRPPFGQRACVSDDGVTWRKENEIVLRDDAPNKDLGYPASVELEPGLVLTVYYQPNVGPGTVQRMRPPDPDRVKPGILGTVWRVPPAEKTESAKPAKE